MRAGFARADITPPLGTTMMGFSSRDIAHGCDAVHDPLFVRALYVEHEAEQALIMGFDLCFLGREEADRYKGAIGRRLDLLPRQILLNTSHSHTGPSVGRWAFADYNPPDRLYLDELERACVAAACDAHGALREATLWAGTTTSDVPVSRRKIDEHGKAQWGVNPDGVVCDTLPICLLEDRAGEPLCLLFSVSCHPSILAGFEISAEYPGVAMDRLDAHLGTECSLFLQGTGGDAKPSCIGNRERWRSGDHADVAKAGGQAAHEVIAALDAGLTQVAPKLTSASEEMLWPLQPAMDRAGFQAIADSEPSGTSHELRRLWAQRQIERMDRGQALASHAPIAAHGVQLGHGLRIVGIEGEAVAGLGLRILDFYSDGVTFPLGYTDGAQLYLPTESMLAEGGYEVDSYYEYGFPAPFAPGFEVVLMDTLETLRSRGVE